ncbi:hypothetical protein [Streptomyces sp. SID3343]|uniref:hypothetical protein n=1 Tax=Streptomyces sp. SID3343 TaxID=2690260 RepID=UPI00136A3246|nr:hypothetical protein [Streptomyces sp. SID3343]MYV98006.1 hypothetical protein [Streptomyces sp. SID3343]
MPGHHTSEESTWIEGQTSIPVLRDLIQGTTFLDWARPGVTQNVKMKNATKQNVYVLERTRILFVIADTTTAIISLVKGTTVKGMVEEAVVRAVLNIKTWVEDLNKKISDAVKDYQAGRIDFVTYTGTVTKATVGSIANLNGDARTLFDAVVDIFGRVRADDVHSDLAELPHLSLTKDDPFTKDLIERFRKQGTKIEPGETKPVRESDLAKGLAVFSATNQPPENLKDAVSVALQAVNIGGVGNVAGQLGFPTVDMYVMTHDGLQYAHMTTAPNISWIAKPDRIVPARDDGTGQTELPGLGYYLWSNTSKGGGVVNLQNLNRVAYNALESIGFDRGLATVVLYKLRAKLVALSGKEDGPSNPAAATTAEVLALPNFRKLFWMVYTREGEGDDRVENAVYNTMKHITWYVDSKTITTFHKDSAAVEKHAKVRLDAKDFGQWNSRSSDGYDACVSAGRYGISFDDADEYLLHIALKFAVVDIWPLSAPRRVGKKTTASDYVQIIAALHACACGDNRKVHDLIDRLGAFYENPAGDPRWQVGDSGKLLAWWKSKKPLPDLASVTVYAANTHIQMKNLELLMRFR